MKLLSLLFWLFLKSTSPSKATCVLNEIHGEDFSKDKLFRIAWKINYEEEAIDVFLSSFDKSLLSTRHGYLAFGLSEVFIVHQENIIR